MRFVMAATLAIGMMCGTASAGVWFSGYIDPANNYRYYAFTDWDTPLFGTGILPDSDVYGVSAPGYVVDGHVIFEALGNGDAKVIESTGSYAVLPGFTVGSIQPVSFQFSGWWNMPSAITVVSETRANNTAQPGQFISFVSGRVADDGVVPEAGSLAIWSIGGMALLAYAAATKKRAKGQSNAAIDG